jgi:Pyruvate/2-oxoacid:ferredoxin oxidoreductase delta subunit
MVVVKRVRKLGARGGSVGASGGTSSARPQFVAKEAPCTHSCPAGTDVRGFLTTLARGGSRGLTEAQAIEEAFYLIAERNPLPAVCGRLCPHHCETGCTREAYDGGVSVNQVERAIAEAAINASWALRRLEDGRQPEAVTVVGAGAAGLSAAYQLARRGYDVTIADPHEQPGGELRYGIDAERLPRAVLDAEIDRVLALGVTFVGLVDLAAVEASAPRVVKTQVYESGTPVATGSIAAAVHFGRHAAALLDAEIRGAVADPAVRLPPVDTGKVMVDHFPRQARGAATGETWSPAGAVSEAQRCLSCGACFECDNCWKYCPDQAVIRPLERGQPYRFKLEFCQGCSKCAEQCPSNYIEMR